MIPPICFDLGSIRNVSSEDMSIIHKYPTFFAEHSALIFQIKDLREEVKHLTRLVRLLEIPVTANWSA